MFTPTDISIGVVTWAEMAQATILKQKQEIDAMREELDALKESAQQHRRAFVLANGGEL